MYVDLLARIFYDTISYACIALDITKRINKILLFYIIKGWNKWKYFHIRIGVLLYYRIEVLKYNISKETGVYCESFDFYGFDGIWTVK